MAVFRTATAENIGPASAGDAVPHATSMLGHSSSQSQVFQTMESVLDLLRKVDDPIKLGKELGVDDETLREIEGHGGNSEQQMSEVIDTWIKKKISWKTLADAVERIGYHQSAQEIRSWKNTICKTEKQRSHKTARQASQRFGLVPYPGIAKKLMVSLIVTLVLSLEYIQVNKATLMVPDGSQFIQTFVNSEVIQTMDLSQFGFKLHFPPHTSLKPVTFTIGVSLSPWQDFIPPPNTTLVSALYYIKVSPGLLQPVIIEIQHCINPDWVKNTTLTFAKAHTDAFEKLSGGRFGRNSWGAIQLSNFSYLAIFTNSENATSRSVYYLAHILTSHHKGTPGIYQVDLVISRKLNAIKEVIRKEYLGWMPVTRNPISFVFHNESPQLTLGIRKDGVRSGNWEIKPTAIPPTISRSAIDDFDYEAFELRVYWKSEEEAVPLEYYMNVYGISRDSFLIFIDPHEEGAIITSNADGTKDDVRTHDLTSEIKDVNELCQEVAEIGNWDVLCSYLGVNPAKMDKLRHSNAKIKEKKQECLRAYFDMGEANWNDVAEVIKKPPISNNRVAKRIAKKHNLRDEL